MRSQLLVLSVTTALGLVSLGCVKKFTIDGQLEGTRQASASTGSIADYEVGRVAITSGLAQFEGIHSIDPDNTDGLYLLLKTWTAYGSVVAEDDLQVAQDANNDEAVEVARKRAKFAYARAVFYGLQLLGQKDEGFAKVRSNQVALNEWLKTTFTEKEDAPNLLWTGVAWLSRVAVMAGDEEEGPALIAELYVADSLLERAVALDASLDNYTGLVALAGYHGRSSTAEMDDEKRLLDLAAEKTGGKNLLVPLSLGIRYACAKGDAAMYQAYLNKVIQADDPDPDERLGNAIAKRTAKRWLGKHRAKDQCGIDVGGPSPATPEPTGVAAPPPPPPASTPEPSPPAEPKPAKPAKPDHPHKPTAMVKPAKATR